MTMLQMILSFPLRITAGLFGNVFPLRTRDAGSNRSVFVALPNAACFCVVA